MLYLRRLLAAITCCLFVFSSVAAGAFAQEALAKTPDATHGEEANTHVISDGTHVLDASALKSLTGLSVLEGATAVIDFGSKSNLSLINNLTNAGTIYAVSSNPKVHTAHLSAASILNGSGAVLTTVLPAGGLPGLTDLVSNLNLHLSALKDIINAGTISSAGDLTLEAGASIVNQATMMAAQNVNVASAIGSIVNSGSINALAGNININSLVSSQLASQVLENISVNNSGGMLQALAGAINVRDVLYSGAGNLAIRGGDLLARQLNLFSGQGTIDLTVGRLDGELNIAARASHVTAATDTLTIGSAKLDGDPAFINSSGGILINGLVTASESLAILANGDITASGANARIELNSSTATPFNLLMIAGAAITANGNSNSSTLPGGTATTSDVTVDFNSGNGGNIDLTGSTFAGPVINTSGVSGGAGGNVVLAARASGATGGRILLPAAIVSQGNGGGANGNVTLIAGAGTGTAIDIGVVNTGGGTGGGGAVSLVTAQPTGSGGQTVTVQPNGTIAGGASVVPAITIENAAVSTRSITTNGADISVLAGSDINTHSTDILASRNGSAGNGGNVTLTATGASSTISFGSITSNGFDTGSGGTVTLSVGGALTIDGTLPAITARSGLNGGNGGTFVATAGGALTVNSVASIDVSPQAPGGNGGNFTLTGASVAINGPIITAGANGTNGASAGDPGTDAGAGGAITVTARGGPLSISSTLTSTGGNGGAGADGDFLDNTNGGNGGNGGGGGLITLSSLMGPVVIDAAISSQGGDGGSGGAGNFLDTFAVSGAGGDGGDGGASAGITVDANTALTVNAALISSGGAGGNGGTGASLSQNEGGQGGTGGAGGGAGAINLAGDSLVSITVPIALTGAAGGNGGAGGDGSTDGGYGADGGNGGAGGVGGAGANLFIASASGSITTTSLSSTGGAGGNGGTGGAGDPQGPPGIDGIGGNGGTGGAGGRIYMEATVDSIATGNVSSMGGSGGSGGSGSTAGSPGATGASRNITLAGGSDVLLRGNITTAGAPITIVSVADILAEADNIIIDSSNPNGDGGPIRLVAGTGFFNNGSNLELTGAAPNGGTVNLNVSATKDVIEIDAQGLATDSNGADIWLIAYTAGGDGGAVLLPASSSVCTCGNGTGDNGNLLVLAGAPSGTAITLGSADTAMGGGTGGAITIATSQPDFSSGTSMVFDADGNIVSGNTFVHTSTSPASILIPSFVDVAGALSLAAGDTITIDSAAITIGNDAPVIIRTPNLVFAASTADPSITASGASEISIDASDVASDVDLTITAPSGGSATIATGSGGSIVMGPTGQGNFRVSASGSGATTINLNGAPVDLNGLGAFTFDQNVTVSTDTAVVVNMNNVLNSQLFTLNGVIEATASNPGSETVLIQALFGGFELAGSGTIRQSGANPGNTVFNDFTFITFHDDADLTIDSVNPGSNTFFFTQNLQVTKNTTGPAAASLTVTNNDNIFIGSWLPCPPCDVSFDVAGLASSATLTLNGAPISTVTTSPGGPVEAINVGANFTLQSDSSITFNTSNGLFRVDGNVTTTTAGTEIMVLSAAALNVIGAGSMAAPGGITFTADLPLVNFNTAGFFLTGDVIINAINGITSVTPGGSVGASAGVTVNACTVVNPNGLNGGAFTLNVSPDCGPIGTGGGTIVNTGGDVILSKDLVINSNGLDVAIIASGNVRSQGKLRIDLSSKTGNGGNLNIFAGVEIVPPSPGQVKDSTTAFAVLGPSETGGDVQLSSVRISTGTKAAGATGGNVTIVANAGTSNSGMVNTGRIDTSAPSGMAGDVTVIGEGGVSISGNVTATGAIEGGGVGLFAAPPVQDGPIAVFNGLVVGGHFEADCPVCGSNGAVFVKGSINTSSGVGIGGNVTMGADRLVTIGGSIITGGLAGCCASGGLGVETNGGTFIVGKDVNLSGFSIKSKTSPDDAGDAGSAFILGTAWVQIGGNLLARGGSTVGSGNGGAGGGVLLIANPVAGANDYAIGSFVVNGYVDLRGGNSTGGGGGDGGQLGMSIGKIAIKGSNHDFSINAAGGAGVNPGADGMVGLETFAVQPLPTVFDLTSTNFTEYALPGGLFAVGEKTVVNGTRGGITDGTAIVTLTNIRESNSPFTAGNIEINVVGGAIVIDQGGGSVTISPDTVGVRNLITPGQALAAFQVSRDSTAGIQTIGLNASGQVIDASPNGGGFSRMIVDYFELGSPAPMTAFNLATVQTNKVTLNVDGPGAWLNLSGPKTINIAGTVDFITTGVNAVVALGNRSLSIASTGRLLASDSGMLSVNGTNPALTNNGAIRASAIFVLNDDRPVAIVMGSSATIGDADPFGPPGSVQVNASNLTITGGSFVDTVLSADGGGKPGNATIITTFDATSMLADMSFSNITVQVQPSGSGSLQVAPGAVVAASSSLILASAGGLTVGNLALLSSRTTMSLLSLGPTTISAGSSLLAGGGNLTINALGLTVGNGATLQAGTLAPSAPPTGVLSKQDIAAPGSLTIISVVAGVDIQSQTAGGTMLRSFGGNLTITAVGGSISVGDAAHFRADGGNLQLLADGQISGGQDNFFTARAVGKTGGGIELGSGLIISTNLQAAFQQPSGTAPPPSVLGTNVIINNGGGTLGVVQAITSGGGTLNLSSSGANQATLNLNRGVMVFDTLGSGSSVELDGGTFTTDALLPIGYQHAAPWPADPSAIGSPGPSSELIVDTGDCELDLPDGQAL